MNIPFIAFTEREHIQRLLENELSSLTGRRPLFYKNVEDLKIFVEHFPKLQFLLIDVSKENSEIIHFKNEILSQSHKFDHLIILDSTDSPDLNQRFFSQDDTVGLITYLKEILNEFKRPQDDWFSIPLQSLHHFQTLPCDIYLKISSTRYIKRLNAMDSLESDLVRNFQLRGIYELFISARDEKQFTKKLINNLLSNKKLIYLNEREKLKARSSVFETTKKLIHSFDLNPKIIQVCYKLIQSIYEINFKNSDLQNYINLVRNNKDYSFHYSFIELSSALAAHLLSATGINDYRDKLKILITANFFSDLSLTEPEFIHHIHEDMQKDYELQNHVEVMTHAWKSHKMLSSSPLISQEVCLIIKEHHGATEGIGFPRQKASGRLNNLSKCLILSQEIAYHVLMNPQMTLFEVLEMTTKCHDEIAARRIMNIFRALGDKNDDVKAS